MLMCDSASHCVPTHTSTGVYVCVCVCIHRYSFTHACVLVCAYAFVCVFACVCACVTSSISMEIKRCSSHEFTHSPCFDSIQSTVCIITLVPYGNLLGPKYCSLTNPSFVFSRYTKHQSCFSTHAVHPPHPLHTHIHTAQYPNPPSSHTHTQPQPANHAPPHSPETQSSVEPKAGWLEQQDMLGSGFVINISLFQMVPPTMQKDTTTGPADREGLCFGGKDKNKGREHRIKHRFPWRWKARWQRLDAASHHTHL